MTSTLQGELRCEELQVRAGRAPGRRRLGYLFITGFQRSAATQVTLAPWRREQRAAAWATSACSWAAAPSSRVPSSGPVPPPADFAITDGQRVLRVRYTGSTVLPDTFKRRPRWCWREGTWLPGPVRRQGGVRQVPSKYEGQDYQGHVDAAEHADPLSRISP